MQIILTPDESLKYFYSALCNGLQWIAGYGLEFTFDRSLYSKSRAKITGETCYEDVLIQMLKDGYSLAINDVEGDGAYNSTIKLQDVYDRVCLTPIRHLSDMINENDDSITADAILQTVFFKEIIFG